MASPVPAPLKDAVGGLDCDGFVTLLSKLIGESARLQNDPPTHRPQEDLVAQHVVDALRPVSTETGGGPLVVRKVSYAEGRSNVIVEYPGTVPGRVVSFVGMHMDVVPANPSEWAINSMEMNMEALKEIQKRFYADFLPHEKERVYKFATPSTMKPTKWSYPGGGLNQIPGECTISGDIRLTPFYSTSHVVEKLKAYVEDINETLETTLDTRGPVSKYVLPDENLRGRLEITFDGDVMNGVACNLESRGFKALCKATEEIVGHVEPYSITGSLPLIRELQDEGFDVQTAGYGLLKTYHAKNEYCLLPDMAQGFQVFVSIISQLEEEV